MVLRTIYIYIYIISRDNLKSVYRGEYSYIYIYIYPLMKYMRLFEIWHEI